MNNSDILLEFQHTCESSGRYIEAEMAKRRLVEVKTELDRRNKEETKQRHE